MQSIKPLLFVQEQLTQIDKPEAYEKAANTGLKEDGIEYSRNVFNSASK